MQIKFEKISTTPKPFSLSHQAVSFEGTLEKAGYHRVALVARIRGEIELQCDRCGDSYTESLHTPLKLTISDQILDEKDDLDMIEFLDGDIDLVYILESELNALEGEYHYCEKCGDTNEAYEVEF